MEIKYCSTFIAFKGQCFKGKLNRLSPLLIKCSLKTLCAQWESITRAGKPVSSMVPGMHLQLTGCISFKHPGGTFDEHSLYKENILLLQLIYRFPNLSVLKF